MNWRRSAIMAAGLAGLTLAMVTASAAQDVSPGPKLRRMESLKQLPAEEWRVHQGDVLHAEDPNFDDSSWQIAKPGFEWRSGMVWFRRTIQVPADLNGYDLTGADIYFQFAVWGDHFPVTIYFDGRRVAMGDDLEPIALFHEAQPGQKVAVAIKAAAFAGSDASFHEIYLPIRFAAARPSPGLIADEIVADRAFLQTVPENQAANLERIGSALNAIDIGALDRKDQAAFDASLRAAQAALDPLKPVLAQYTIHATGNSHIDMAWLWPRTETVEVTRNTFRSSLQLMDEYPNYTFTQSTAQMSEWMEQKYPNLFAEIKKRVAEGRWELVGGMWVEPDLNMPDGESLVRQLLVGKRYFQEKFGQDVRIGWNPDSFGYSWQLPQIYKKSGMDYFVTQKLSWNDTNKPTMKLFWWEAPDGSRVLTYFPHDYANDLGPVRMAEDFADARRKTPGIAEMMHLYGIGDHGGGPTRWMLDSAEPWIRGGEVYPRVELGTAQQFFDYAEKAAPALHLPVWDSELYLEFHRGVFTTQAEQKKHNRESEELMLNAEKFSSLAFLDGEAYPSAPLLYAWKKVLFNQFHDLAAGSGIADIYHDASHDYATVKNIADGALHSSLGTLSEYADTSGAGSAVVAFNPLSWERSDVAEAKIELPGRTIAKFVRVTDAAGRAMPVEIVSTGPAANAFTIRFLARDVPSLGYKVFYVNPAAGPAVAPRSLVARQWHLENEFLSLDLDPRTGCITSLKDKASGEEAIAPGGCGNLLQAFHDQPKEYDAWNIDADFEKQRWDLDKAESVQLLDRGPLQAVIRVTRKFQNSTFVQDVTVTTGVPRVDIRTDADWHEKHILIKAAFPLTAHNDNATYEIPYGSIERPTTRRNSFERARFEVPAIRWADLSDARHGFSLLNDCKYGYDGKGNVLRISLLRSPSWPDPHADEGRHEFTYSLYPHAGDWKQAQTVRRGYELNYRLIAIPATNHFGELGPEHSYLRVDGANVVVTALKKAEDGDDLVLRFYEWAGRAGDVTVHLPAGAESAVEANLMEKPGNSLPVRQGAVTVPVTPYEIETILIDFARPKAVPAGIPSPQR